MIYRTEQLIFEKITDKKFLNIAIPCQNACPLDVDISNCLESISLGDFENAFINFKKSNPFPSIMGRICEAYCEKKCRRNYWDTAISIRQLERFCSDMFLEEEKKFYPQIRKRKEKIAIIGGGLFGLSVSFDLALMGYQIDIYEKENKVGGFLNLLPEFILPENIKEQEFAELNSLGIQIKTNENISENKIKTLQEQYDAVILSTGIKARYTDKKIDSSHIENVFDTFTFIKKINEIDTLEKKKIVLFGGNFLISICARLSQRKNPEKVSIYYENIKSELDISKNEIRNLNNERIKFNYLHHLKKLNVEKTKLTGIIVEKNKLHLNEENGKRIVTPINGTDKQIDCDLLIYSPEIQSIPKTPLYNYDFQNITEEIEKKNVFFGGSIINPSLSFVDTISSAHHLAFKINNYLLKEKDIIKPKFEETATKILTNNEILNLEDKSFISHPIEFNELEFEDRINNYEECTFNYTEKQAIEESQRCFRCNYDINMKLNFFNCTHCGICVDVCPKDCFTQHGDDITYKISSVNKNLFCETDIKDYLKKSMIEKQVRFENKKDCIRCFKCVRECPYGVFEVIKFTQKKKWLNEDKFTNIK